MKLQIKKMGINGEGIGYDNRIPVFCKGAYPHETAEVRITGDYQSYKIAECIEILKKSQDRIQPVCRKSGLCDACSLMALRYDAQLKEKKALLEEALFKYGNVKRNLVRDMHGSKEQLHWRSQCKLPLREKDERLVTGMYRSGTNHFVTVEHCLLHEKMLEKVKTEIMDVLNRHHMKAYDAHTRKGIRYLIVRVSENGAQCTLVTGRENLPDSLIQDLSAIPFLVSLFQSKNTEKHSVRIFGSKTIRLSGEEFLRTDMHGLSLYLSPESFFQLNRSQAERLYETAVSKIDPCETAVEAYCGIGVMSLMAHQKAAHIVGIENVPAAIENAKKNALQNRIRNVDFLAMDAAEGLYRTASRNHVDVLLADPPRSGMDDNMIEAIMKTDIDKIIYVSCNPATLAKNLKTLKQKYQVRTVIPFDLFPNTPLIESITVLTKG